MILKSACLGVLSFSLLGAAELTKTENIDYVGEGNPRQMLDLYLPEAKAGKSLPVIVWVHGGAWAKGSKNRPGFAIRAAELGECAVVSINYRLTDEAHWPAQIHDCKAAVRWVRANAGKYHLDPKRIVVWGASAGGHLVAMLGTTQDVEKYEGKLGKHAGVSSKVAAVVNFFGPADFVMMNEQGSSMNHNRADSPEGKLLGGTVSERKDLAREASPLYQVSKEDAPILTVHGTKDPLVPYVQGRDFDAKLDQAGVASTLITVTGGGHGSGFGMAVQAEVKSFLENHLFGKSNELKDKVVLAGK